MEKKFFIIWINFIENPSKKFNASVTVWLYAISSVWIKIIVISNFEITIIFIQTDDIVYNHTVTEALIQTCECLLHNGWQNFLTMSHGMKTS